MSNQALAVERDKQVATVTLNRPHALNALNSEMVAGLHEFFSQLPTDRECRVVILRGAGRAFCAGLDLKEGEDGASDVFKGSIMNGLHFQRRLSGLVIMMRRVPQPIIACVRGPAVGGGFALTLAADVRIAGASARFCAAFVRVGLSGCDMGTSYFLPRLVGMSVASELLLTGRFINAQRALATGLVSEVVADDEADAAARTMAQEMLLVSPLGARLTKECLAASVDAGSLEQVIAMEDRNQTLCGLSPDFNEGVEAFLAKRKPRYSE